MDAMKKKILIAEASTELSEHLCNCLGTEYVLQVCHSGLSVAGMLENFQPDVLVMDLALPGLDGISLLKQITVLPCRPRILVTTCFMSSYVEASIAQLGVDLVVLKPCKAEILVERIQELTQEDDSLLALHLQPHSSIASMLMHLNIPSKRRGFTYLERGIQLYMQLPCQTLTKTLYPDLAREYFTQPEAVERAIRQVIHESWAKRDDKVWRLYFSIGREGIIPRPTNAEFISQLAEHHKQAQERRA
jgi:two-component system response regulator (stage 0 sporulation protein A)